MIRTLLPLLSILAVAGCNGTGNGGVTGAAPARYMGERGNVNGTYDGSTSSSTYLKQQIKESETGRPPS